MFSLRVAFPGSGFERRGTAATADEHRCKVTVRATPHAIAIPGFGQKVTASSSSVLTSVAPKITAHPEATAGVAAAFVTIATGASGEDRLTLLPSAEKEYELVNAAPTAHERANALPEDAAVTHVVNNPDTGATVATVAPAGPTGIAIAFPHGAPTARLLQAVLRGVAYENTGAVMSGATRQVEFTAVMRDGGSCVVTMAVAVHVPDLPATIDVTGAIPDGAGAAASVANDGTGDTAPQASNAAAVLRHQYSLKERAAVGSAPAQRWLLVAPKLTLTSCHTAADTHPVLRVEFLQAPAPGDTIGIAPTGPSEATAKGRVSLDEASGSVSVDDEHVGNVTRRSGSTVVTVSFLPDTALAAMAAVLRRVAYRVNLDASTARRALRQRQKAVQLSFKPKGKLWTRVTVGVTLSE